MKKIAIMTGEIVNSDKKEGESSMTMPVISQISLKPSDKVFILTPQILQTLGLKSPMNVRIAAPDTVKKINVKISPESEEPSVMLQVSKALPSTSKIEIIKRKRENETGDVTSLQSEENLNREAQEKSSEIKKDQLSVKESISSTLPKAKKAKCKSNIKSENIVEIKSNLNEPITRVRTSRRVAKPKIFEDYIMTDDLLTHNNSTEKQKSRKSFVASDGETGSPKLNSGEKKKNLERRKSLQTEKVLNFLQKPEDIESSKKFHKPNEKQKEEKKATVQILEEEITLRGSSVEEAGVKRISKKRKSISTEKDLEHSKSINNARDEKPKLKEKCKSIGDETEEKEANEKVRTIDSEIMLRDSNVKVTPVKNYLKKRKIMYTEKDLEQSKIIDNKSDEHPKLNEKFKTVAGKIQETAMNKKVLSIDSQITVLKKDIIESNEKKIIVENILPVAATKLRNDVKMAAKPGKSKVNKIVPTKKVCLIEARDRNKIVKHVMKSTTDLPIILNKQEEAYFAKPLSSGFEDKKSEAINTESDSLRSSDLTEDPKQPLSPIKTVLKTTPRSPDDKLEAKKAETYSPRSANKTEDTKTGKPEKPISQRKTLLKTPRSPDKTRAAKRTESNSLRAADTTEETKTATFEKPSSPLKPTEITFLTSKTSKALSNQINTKSIENDAPRPAENTREIKAPKPEEPKSPLRTPEITFLMPKPLKSPNKKQNIKNTSSDLLRPTDKTKDSSTQLEHPTSPLKTTEITFLKPLTSKQPIKSTKSVPLNSAGTTEDYETPQPKLQSSTLKKTQITFLKPNISKSMVKKLPMESTASVPLRSTDRTEETRASIPEQPRTPLKPTDVMVLTQKTLKSSKEKQRLKSTESISLSSPDHTEEHGTPKSELPSSPLKTTKIRILKLNTSKSMNKRQLTKSTESIPLTSDQAEEIRAPKPEQLIFPLKTTDRKKKQRPKITESILLRSPDQVVKVRTLEPQQPKFPLKLTKIASTKPNTSNSLNKKQHTKTADPVSPRFPDQTEDVSISNSEEPNSPFKTTEIGVVKAKTPKSLDGVVHVISSKSWRSPFEQPSALKPDPPVSSEKKGNTSSHKSNLSISAAKMEVSTTNSLEPPDQDNRNSNTNTETSELNDTRRIAEAEIPGGMEEIITFEEIVTLPLRTCPTINQLSSNRLVCEKNRHGTNRVPTFIDGWFSENQPRSNHRISKPTVGMTVSLLT